MPTVIQSEVLSLVTSFGHARYKAVEVVAHEGAADGIGPALIVAIGIRESGLRNIVGDGGHGRGWLQIDDRSHAEWLRTRAGCHSGSWDFATGHHALDAGFCPGLTAATDYAITLLRQDREYAKHTPDPEAFMVAAYNCGAGNAYAGLKRGSVDHFTTGGDYSRDVLHLRDEVARAVRSLSWA